MTIKLAKEDEYMLGALFGGDETVFTEDDITDVVIEEVEPDDDDNYADVYGKVRINRAIELDFTANLPAEDFELSGGCRIYLISGHIFTVDLWRHQYHLMKHLENIVSKAITEELDRLSDNMNPKL